MEIVYFTCLVRVLVQFHMENKEQLRQKMGNSFVNGSTAISVYVNEYLFVISLGCWLELTLHFRSKDSTYISCKDIEAMIYRNNQIIWNSPKGGGVFRERTISDNFKYFLKYFRD
ncbi:hypothetical protein T09_8312 [Trichinella sp. T9]|nr:hypothetical protein T09_8312 [Trichinella sp. T9]